MSDAKNSSSKIPLPHELIGSLKSFFSLSFFKKNLGEEEEFEQDSMAMAAQSSPFIRRTTEGKEEEVEH